MDLLENKKNNALIILTIGGVILTIGLYLLALSVSEKFRFFGRLDFMFGTIVLIAFGVFLIYRNTK